MSRPASADPHGAAESSADLGASAVAQLDFEPGRLEEAGMGSSSSVTGGSQRSGNSGSDEAAAAAQDSQFTNWSYKNVELLNERNREMAEQLAELRTESWEK